MSDECRIASVPEVVEIIDRMIEEVYRELQYTIHDTDRLILLAKRNTLSEVHMRLRFGTVNHRWHRMHPSATEAELH